MKNYDAEKKLNPKSYKPLRVEFAGAKFEIHYGGENKAPKVYEVKRFGVRKVTDPEKTNEIISLTNARLRDKEREEAGNELLLSIREKSDGK